MENRELMNHTKNIRRNIVKMISSAHSGHPGGSLSAADILSVLYFEVMDITIDNVMEKKRDRFVLSKGHASPLLYATLFECGILQEDLSTFRKINSRLQGHPNMNYTTGVDMSTGSLGQGISVAVGMAMANKLDKTQHRIYVLLGDGECEEGEVWEAAMSASHYHLDNLCAIVDYNSLQIDGNIEEVMSPTPIDEKFKAFGWHVIHIDAHNYDEIRTSFKEAKTIKDQPTLILAHSIKGKGVSFMENQASWHGSAPNDVQCAQALAELEVE